MDKDLIEASQLALYYMDLWTYGNSEDWSAKTRDVRADKKRMKKILRKAKAYEQAK